MGNEKEMLKPFYEWINENIQWFYGYDLNNLFHLKPMAIFYFKCSGSIFLKTTAHIYYAEWGIKDQMDEMISKVNKILGFDALTEYKGV